MSTVFERVKKVIVDQLAVDDEEEVKLKTSFIKDLNADSLELVELMIALEEEFSDGMREMAIPVEDAKSLGKGTVQEAVDYLKSKGAGDDE